jgi:hypothetical protein
MIVKVSLGFAKLTDPQLVTKADRIINGLTGNAAFPTPSPSVASVQTSVTAFQDALAEAADGGRTKTALKNDARETLLTKLRTLALYVQVQCDNDLATLLSSGFDATKPPTPAGILPAPQNVTLTQGTLSGQLDLRAQPLTNAGSYEGQLTTDLNKQDGWETIGNFTAAKMTAQELTPGEKYWGRLRAIGAAGPGAWSDPVAAIAI